MTDNSTKMIADFLESNTAPPVILCIGTDKVSGDSFGPTVGTLLTQVYKLPYFVYGTLERPVTALNLLKTIEFIRFKHSSQPIIAVDCALGKADEIGKLNIVKGGIRAGLGVGKHFPPVGELSITAVVEKKETPHLLSSVKQAVVIKLAIEACNALTLSSKERLLHLTV
jgi:putative sporulation protein YyaC